MTAARRLFTAGVLTVALALSSGLPATAHNGVGAAFKGRAGRYTVYAYDGYRLPNGLLEYRLVLLDAATGEPVSGIAPVITARPQGEAAPVRSAPATVLNNVVLYDLPNPYPHDWTVTVALSGPLGRGRAQFPMHGQAPYVPPAVHTSSGGSTGPWLPIGIAAGAAIAAGAVFLMLRRRRRGAGSFLAG